MKWTRTKSGWTAHDGTVKYTLTKSKTWRVYAGKTYLGSRKSPDAAKSLAVGFSKGLHHAINAFGIVW